MAAVELGYVGAVPGQTVDYKFDHNLASSRLCPWKLATVVGQRTTAADSNVSSRSAL